MDFIVIVVFLVIIIIVSQFGKSKPRQPYDQYHEIERYNFNITLLFSF